MQEVRSAAVPRGWLLAALVLALALVCAPTADAKKKKGSAAVAGATVNMAVPDAPEAPPFGLPTAGPPAKTSLTIGKKFKGKTVANVAVTIKTTGSGEGAGGQLIGDLIAPDGTYVRILGGFFATSIGPLTLQPNSSVEACQPLILAPADPPRCPPETLGPPYAGTVGLAPLRLFDGLPVRGTWTLRLRDAIGPPSAATSTLNSWSLRITPAKSTKK